MNNETEEKEEYYSIVCSPPNSNRISRDISDQKLDIFFYSSLRYKYTQYFDRKT